MPATTEGKEHALEALATRRAENKTRVRVRNEDLYAGSNMHFDCLGCGADISVSESYISKPELCPECSALKKLGWLE